MGSDTTALSVPKDHKNPTYDPDEDGVIDHTDLGGISADQHQTIREETGTVSFGTGTGSPSITFTNTYDGDRSIVAGGMNSSGGPGYGKAFAGVQANRDANGDITGCTVYYESDKGTMSAVWYVIGVVK